MINLIDLRKQNKNDFIARLRSRSQLSRDDIKALVELIVQDIRDRGDNALLEYEKRFDHVDMLSDSIKVAQHEIDDAYAKVEPRFIEVIKKAAENIRAFHGKQLDKSWIVNDENGTMMGQIYRPLECAGIYVPGGRAAYPSSVLMNAIPAQVAGVQRIVMATPPMEDGSVYPYTLVAAKEAGVNEVYRMGGAQAVAAMAFGTDAVPRVDKIVGPGNIYVAMAKRAVYGYVDIDMIAGPSEILIIADSSADPAFIAADLLSQSEHDPMASSILITDNDGLAAKVADEVEKQSAELSRRDIIAQSLSDYGYIILVRDMMEAVRLANDIAPEHIELMVSQPFEMLSSIKNAGSIFLGRYSPEPLGDYMAGPNHVLPTGGTARFYSPLSVDDFIKKSSFIYYSEGALSVIKDDIIDLAQFEGLTAHANSVRVRFE